MDLIYEAFGNILASIFIMVIMLNIFMNSYDYGNMMSTVLIACPTLIIFGGYLFTLIKDVVKCFRLYVEHMLYSKAVTGVIDHFAHQPEPIYREEVWVKVKGIPELLWVKLPRDVEFSVGDMIDILIDPNGFDCVYDYHDKKRNRHWEVS